MHLHKGTSDGRLPRAGRAVINLVTTCSGVETHSDGCRRQCPQCRFDVGTEDSACPFCGTAPEPATNKAFASTLGKVMGRPAWAPVPGVALRIIVGEAEQLLTTGQRVLPKKAQDLGYQFQFSTLEPALRDILS